MKVVCLFVCLRFLDFSWLLLWKCREVNMFLLKKFTISTNQTWFFLTDMNSVEKVSQFVRFNSCSDYFHYQLINWIVKREKTMQNVSICSVQNLEIQFIKTIKQIPSCENLEIELQTIYWLIIRITRLFCFFALQHLKANKSSTFCFFLTVK